MEAILKWALIIAVIGFLLYNFSPCNFNDVKNKIPVFKDMMSDAKVDTECKLIKYSAGGNVTINNTVTSQSLLGEVEDTVTQEGDKVFYGKPTFDCTTNAHCRDAFSVPSMICEVSTGRCYVSGGTY